MTIVGGAVAPVIMGYIADFSKITPSLFTLKEGVFSKITPSLFTLKEGSTSHPYPLQWSLHPLRFPRLRGTETSGAREETALLGARNRYALRLADHQRSSPCFAGWDRLGKREFIVNSLQFTFGGFDDKLLIYCEFLGILEYAYRHSPINGLC